MHGREDVALRRQAEAVQDVPLPGLLRAREGDVVHDVPDQVDPLFDPLLLEVLHGGLRGTEQERGEMVRDDPVQFLRHPAVEAPEAGLHVTDGQVEFRGGESPRERGVGVPVHQDGIGLLVHQHLLEAHQHLPRLAGVRPAADLEVVVRLGEIEDAEEDIAHEVVVVLARVNQKLLVVASNLTADRGGLDELGPRADDTGDSHARETRVAV